MTSQDKQKSYQFGPNILIAPQIIETEKRINFTIRDESGKTGKNETNITVA